MTNARVLWKFMVTDPITKRRRETRCHLSEEDAVKVYGPGVVKLEHTRMEIRENDYGRFDPYR
jgi:hypothetical protein